MSRSFLMVTIYAKWSTTLMATNSPIGHDDVSFIVIKAPNKSLQETRSSFFDIPQIGVPPECLARKSFDIIRQKMHWMTIFSNK